MQTAQEALDNAKVQLICRKDSVFIATVLFSLKFSWDKSIPTACTDGKHMIINPDFFLALPKGQRVFVLAHEAYHVVFMHMMRVGNRRFRLWNIACDYVINWLLKEQHFELWPHCLIDARFAGMEANAVYKILDNENQPDPKDFHEDMKQVSGTGEDLAQAEQEIQDIIINAAVKAKASNQAGTIPGEVEIMIDRLLNPVLPWHVILANQFTAMARNDYSYQRPSRRYLPELIMPTQYSESLGEIAIAVDNSGSVTDAQFTAFISEIDAIQRRLMPERIQVVGFDTQINTRYTLNEGESVNKIKFTGRGGTQIRPLYDWARENKPQALVIFTDGWFAKHEQHIPKGIPIFWIIHSNNKDFTVNRGKVIQYNA